MRLPAAIAVMIAIAGCETLGSDVATRIRYAVGDGAAALRGGSDTSRVVVLRPNTGPDNCGDDPRYTVEITPYKGNKQVPSADIAVHCRGRNGYGTGTELIVTRAMSIQKRSDEPLRITLKKTPAGIEIDRLD